MSHALNSFTGDSTMPEYKPNDYKDLAESECEGMSPGVESKPKNQFLECDICGHRSVLKEGICKECKERYSPKDF